MRELRFLLALWRANLQAAMEHRAAFLTQLVGMVVNNALYLLFWVVFFSRFEQVGGWGLADVALIFGLVAAAFGLATYLFGNVLNLAEIIAEGRLDYYLSLPRPPLLHALASRSVASGLGDLSYGLLTVLLIGPHSAGGLLRAALAILCGVAVMVGFLVLVHSLAFWMGGASQLGQQAIGALVTFATYPLSLFDGTAKLLLLTAMPAALLGSVPASFVRGFSWADMGLLCGAAAAFLALGVIVFQRGLRRYESGSAITSQ